MDKTLYYIENEIHYGLERKHSSKRIVSQIKRKASSRYEAEDRGEIVESQSTLQKERKTSRHEKCGQKAVLK
ncbi:hypothetical protein CHS0354_005529 [Potamilus streckersoni]|uniref:Uncharacterized protein n=1 Tax=Potamilus streckersoni TaxID=2493646 RepID=A0AAE0SB47_9BIVA|nr:hypothetical protein CHS0354_005529 [Potamilus streckersoni]